MKNYDAKALLPVITAFAEGERVEYKNSRGEWNEIDDPSFDGDPERYRIKPEPREIWFNRYPDGREYGPFRSIGDAVDDGDSSQNPVQVRYREVIE